MRSGGTADRRRVLAAGAASALGVSSLALPSSSVAASVVGIESWSGTLTFTEVSETGFTVSWTGV